MNTEEDTILGYWRQMADERVGNPPRGNQETVVVKVKVKVGRSPGELGKADLQSHSHRNQTVQTLAMKPAKMYP